MTSDCSQVPWSDEQWARVNSVIQEEANRARVGAAFLPMIGPLPLDTDFVREETISVPPQAPPLTIEDRTTIQLATLQVMVNLRGAQMADPELTSALDLFRRAANVLARLEDAVVFLGLSGPVGGPIALGAPGIVIPPRMAGVPAVGQILGGQQNRGLWIRPPIAGRIRLGAANNGQRLVSAVSRAIGDLENLGHFGPFAVVLDQDLFVIAETPDPGSLVLPQDRIIPFLGGGPLLRCSVLLPYTGVVVALGGAPVELVVATDMTLQFLQITVAPVYYFRVFEKIVLRVKQQGAIMPLAVGAARIV
jgi:uncharacterized linocin/CFP29 family protein